MTLWEQQWQLFAPDFRDGKAHIDLAPFGSPHTLKLFPGPGFGDFSHPTTRLVLKMMADRCRGQKVLDIGCGSGILSFAAAAFGAQEVVGIDSDPEAVAHARNNLILNPFGCPLSFSPILDPFWAPDLICMNMIPAEQKMAWESLPQLHKCKANILTSGILSEALTSYLAWAEAQGWSLLTSTQEAGWLALLFLSKN